MEPRYRHWKNQGSGPGPVFFTTTVLDFVPIFSSSRFAADMTRLLIGAHAKHNVKLNAFVVMPEHIHFLSSLPARMTASDFGRRLKSFSARHFVPRLSPGETAMFEQQRGLNGRVFWQRSFRSVPVPDSRSFWIKVRYIHRNPVKRGLCERPEEFPFSSATLFQQGFWHEERGLMFDKFGVSERGVYIK